MKIRKRILCAGIFLLLPALCFGCAPPMGNGSQAEEMQQPPTFVEEYDLRDMTEAEYLDRSTDVLLATYLGKVQGCGQWEFHFSVEESLRGDSGSEVYVEMQELPEDLFQEGAQYLLLLEKAISVYQDHDHFVLNHWYPAGEEALQKLRRQLELAETLPEPVGFPYTESREMEEILACSPSIFLVEPVELIGRGTYKPTEVYSCRILQVLRGEETPESSVWVVFFRDTVQPGERYVVLLAQEGSNMMYTLSSGNSLYTPSEAEQLPQLGELMEQAQEHQGRSLPTDEEIPAMEAEWAKKQT